MNIGAETSLTIAILSITALILMIPLPGVNTETQVNIKNTEYSVQLVNTTTLESGDYWGSYDIITNDITLATGGKGIWPFMSTCSHEIQHLKYNLNTDLTTEEEHNRMDGLQDSLLPWNWHTECIKLVPQRLKL